METTLLITDVTRMQEGRVCVAGINSQGISIRPIFQHTHITEGWLYRNGQLIIHPFAWVTFDFLHQRPARPHSEDWVIDAGFKRKVNYTEDNEKKYYLDGFSDRNVAKIFGAEIHHDIGSYIREGEGDRSLGTVEVHITDVFYGMSFEDWDYRITFTDNAGQQYRLKVTDLSFRYYCYHLRDKEGLSPDKISAKLKEQLVANAAFLRIGLARPTWKKHPHCCFLQITGVYTFPDYLDGYCFADFKRP